MDTLTKQPGSFSPPFPHGEPPIFTQLPMWEGNPCRCVHAQDATVDSLYQPRRTLGSHHENTAGGVDTTDMENFRPMHLAVAFPASGKASNGAPVR